MPIYEFSCHKCSRRFSLLTRSWAESVGAACPECGSDDVARLVARFSYHKSVSTIHEESGEPGMFPSDDFYRDPRNIGRWTEKRFADMGLEMPPEVREEIEAAREGELPDSLKDSL